MHEYIKYKLSECVTNDTLAFRSEVEDFISEKTSASDFRALRVPMGIYEQREDGKYMIRVRGAAGLFYPDQLKLISDLSEKYGNGIIHVTSRQDLQLHGVHIKDTPEVLEKLLELGLSTRGGGGNTVRNVSACPLAGACTDEVFDVTPHALALTQYLITDNTYCKLPRKFKVAFSGCSKDCSLASVTDLGFFAHKRDGIYGFSVYAGGGLGAHSACGILIEEFVTADQIFSIAEAAKRLFDKLGDRTNRNKARLRYVLERLGNDEFISAYKNELRQIQQENILFPEIPTHEQSGQESVIHLRLPQGDIQSQQLQKLADIVIDNGSGTIRTTQTQNLQLRSIPEVNLPNVYDVLRKLNENFLSSGHVQCIACVGASVCRLGLCHSKELAEVIEKELHTIQLPFEAEVRISGCHNSCGHHPVAPLGLYGGASRANDKQVPAYTVVAGGHLSEGNSVLATNIAKIPAKAVPGLLNQFFSSAKDNWQPGESFNELMQRWGTQFLKECVQNWTTIPSYDNAPDYYSDFGPSIYK